MKKMCSKCKKEKATLDFNRDKSKQDGLYSSCKLCQRKTNMDSRNKPAGIKAHLKANNKYKQTTRGKFSDWRYQLKRKYGITPKEYDELLEKQNGVCAICGKVEVKKRKNELCVLAVDHCHETGRVRGLLCSTCNQALGFCYDDVNILRGAIRYLEGYA